MDHILIRIILKVLTDCGYKYQLLPLNKPVDGWHQYQSLGPFRADIDSLYMIARPTLKELVESLLENNEAISAILRHENMLKDLNQFNGTIPTADFIKVFLLGKYKEACINNLYGEYNLGKKDGQAD